MAGKGGGGAWKVAYADFVTAMMAFFLVMWIVGQDQKIRRSVADYFSDPLGAASSSSSKKPNRTGSITDYITSGSVPLEERVATGTGRKSHTTNRPFSPATKVVWDWIHNDKEANLYWHKQAKDQRQAAQWSKEVKNLTLSVEEVATRNLMLQLHGEITREVPAKVDGIYRDLLQQIILDVNWGELAQDLIGP